MSNASAPPRLLHDEIAEKYGFQPCEWQLMAINAKNAQRHVVAIALTGSGKTVPLTAPVLLEDEGITIIISALNVITSQIVDRCGGRDKGVLELHGGSGGADMKRADIEVS